MTLSDILAGLPGTIVSRFSASNNAFWIAKCSDILSDLDTECPGPWMVDEVRALPMASGFIKKPFCISRIKGCRMVLQDGRIIYDKECVKEFNELGVELNDFPKSLLSYSSQKVSVSADDDETITIYGSGDYSEKSGATTYTESMDTHDVSITTNTPMVDGFWDGARKVTNTATGSYSTGTVTSSKFLSDLGNGVQSWRMTEDPGYQLQVGKGSFTITPVAYASGTGDMSINSGEDYSDISMTGQFALPSAFDRKKPGRVFGKKDGVLFSSNVIITGYMKTPKPISLADNLMLPPEWDHLIQAGLRWKAEVDMSPSSGDAIICGKLYEKAKKEYISKMSTGQGSIHKKFFQGVTFSVGDLYNA